MTWRELATFIRHLPPDSATGRAVYGESASWTPATYLLADLFDAYLATHTEKGKRPGTYPRPASPTE